MKKSRLVVLLSGLQIEAWTDSYWGDNINFPTVFATCTLVCTPALVWLSIVAFAGYRNVSH